ncbi:VrrA/YqfQ family protein [Peribacillus sp. SCS-26]|uniref:VrrA/YqfQ family protein n=1 Tax=Paraperibacillus marinus TaxID=3115295 RepID=UPI0039065A09
MPNQFPPGYFGNPQGGFSRPQPPQQTGSGASGLLSKILGKGSSGSAKTVRSPFSLPGGAAAGTAASAAAGGGILKSLTQPGGLSGLLDNTQRVLNTVQQVGPVVQQYGPLVKNLPAMWKLYRGLKAAGSTAESDSQETGSQESQAGTDAGTQAAQAPAREAGRNSDPEGASGYAGPKIFF